MATELKEEDINIVYYDFFNHVEKDPVRQKCIESWHKCMPKAKIIRKTENDPEIAEFIKNDEWCQKCIKNNMKNFLVDTIRLWDSLKTDNFLYLDTDVYMGKNILPLLKKHELLAQEVEDIWIDGVKIKDISFQNGTIMWSKKPNENIKGLLEFYKTFECNKCNYNSIANYKYNNNILKKYVSKEVDSYLCHFFCSGLYEHKKKINVAIEAKNYDEDFLKKIKNDDVLIIVYNNNIDKSYPFGRNDVLFVGTNIIPIEIQKEIINIIWNIS